MVELFVLMVLLVTMGVAGCPALWILGVGTIYHVAGYICFKVVVGDLRPVFHGLVDEVARGKIGWS